MAESLQEYLLGFSGEAFFKTTIQGLMFENTAYRELGYSAIYHRQHWQLSDKDGKAIDRIVETGPNEFDVVYRGEKPSSFEYMTSLKRPVVRQQFVIYVDLNVR